MAVVPYLPAAGLRTLGWLTFIWIEPHFRFAGEPMGCLFNRQYDSKRLTLKLAVRLLYVRKDRYSTADPYGRFSWLPTPVMERGWRKAFQHCEAYLLSVIKDPTSSSLRARARQV